MRIVALVGLKKCGKTTTAEALIREFVTRGYQVGSIKFMPNSTLTLDVEGKDTWRHKNAGSDFVISLSRGEIGFIGGVKGKAALKDAFKLVRPNTDVLICEGLNEVHDDLFRILLVKDTVSIEQTLEERGFEEGDFDAISGIISNTLNEHHSLTIFNATRLDEIEALVDLIIRKIPE